MAKYSNGTRTATSKATNMKRRLIQSLLTACCAAAPLALAAPGVAQAQSVMRPANDLVLSIGRGQLVSVPGAMADVFVANDTVADVQIKSQRQLYVFGKAGGETTVYASNARGDVIWSANIRVGSNIESVDQMLHLAMPDAKINVSTMGTNTFLLTGTVAAPEDAAEAQRLVAAYVGGKDQAAANVISRLKMATPLQVNLQVRFAEVSRSLVRTLNTNIMSRDTTSGILFGMSRGRSPGTITGTPTGNLPRLDPSASLGLPANTLPPTPFDPTSGKFVYQGTQYATSPNPSGLSTMNLAGHFLGLDILSALDLGETVGLVTTLSQPNLTALSGETADFLAGGEYPIPISQGLGSTSIEYKKYGVSLAYTPTVLANGRISIRVRPEVSELSTQGSVQFNGFQVPALTIRRAETTVELGSGQSFMIAGLLSNKSQHAIEKIPGAGDVPILGALFRSTSFQKGETELVIVVTPYLVNPVDANDIKLPTDGHQDPNDIQRIFGNQLTDGKSGASRLMPTEALSNSSDRPQVSGLTAPAPAGRAASGGSNQSSRKGRKTADTGNAPAPGFNLK